MTYVKHWQARRSTVCHLKVSLKPKSTFDYSGKWALILLPTPFLLFSNIIFPIIHKLDNKVNLFDRQRKTMKETTTKNKKTGSTERKCRPQSTRNWIKSNEIYWNMHSVWYIFRHKFKCRLHFNENDMWQPRLRGTMKHLKFVVCVQGCFCAGDNQI